MASANSKKWAQIGVMLAVLIALYVIAPKVATAFAVGVLLIAGGYGFQTGKFTV